MDNIFEYNLLSKAEDEFTRLKKSDILLDYKDEILALLKKIDASIDAVPDAEQTILSTVGTAIISLFNNKPLSLLTNNKDEWEAPEGKYGARHSKRMLNVILLEGKIAYLDAILWEDTDGYRFSGEAYIGSEKYTSRMAYRKSLPCMPPQFIVSVEKRPFRDGFRYYVINPDVFDTIKKEYVVLSYSR